MKQNDYRPYVCTFHKEVLFINMTCYDGSVFRWFSVMKSTFYKYKIL